MRVEIFQFFIKRASFVHAKRAADFREGARQHKRQVMLYTGEEYVIPLYKTNNFGLMRSIWKHYSYYLCITKDKTNERRIESAFKHLF